MKKKFEIVFWICGIFIVIFLSANILIGIYAPKIIEQQIQQNLKLKASLGKISLSLPFTVNLEKLEIGNLANIKKVSFSPNLAALFFGKIVIHGLTILEPVINLEQSADGKLNLPVTEQKGKPPAIYLTSLNLREGKVIFTDKKISADGFQAVITKLNIKVAKVAFPITSLETNFEMSAQLLGSQGEPFGDIAFSGWLDYLAKDLDAVLEIKGLDVTKFSAYYGNFISNRKLTSARLDVVSAFTARSNALHIATKFNLSNLVYAQAQNEQLNIDLMKNALDLFTDTKGNLRLEFDIDTLLDKPSLSPEKIKGIILKAAMKNLSNQSPQQLIDKVATVIDQYKGLGKELKEIFN
ncbi:MAG: DUF748 domain-containing protein [Candidatus Omnitrophica bacterium]|nr:DUF748 domain-containing protein [Candidatus Omnitrophota bacterium]